MDGTHMESGLKEYFDLDIAVLQEVARWSTDLVSRALQLYARHVSDDHRPRDAFAEAAAFAETGTRTNRLRKAAMASYKASRETESEPARFAANAVSLYAAIAYTHPFRDKKQARHILGPIVNAAFAIETEPGSRESAELIIESSARGCDEAVKRLLLEYPRQDKGTSRIDRLYFVLDQGIVNRNNQENDHEPTRVQYGPKGSKSR